MTARFYPYDVLARTGSLTVTKVSVDGNRPDRDLQSQAGALDMSELPAWKRALVRLQADLPSEELEGRGDIDLVATLHCRPTNLRTASRMHALGAGRWQGEMVLDRVLLAGRAEVSVIAAGRVGESTHRYLGQTNVVRVYLDAPRRPLPNNVLPVRWVDFTGSDSPVPPEFRDQPHYTDLSVDPPTIWLNSAFPGLRNLLASERNMPDEAKALRSIYLQSIATGGWLALFNASAAALADEDGDAPVAPALPWQEQVLEKLLPGIYPDLILSAAMARLGEDVNDPDSSRLVQSRALASIGGLLRTTRELRRAVALQAEAADDAIDEELA